MTFWVAGNFFRCEQRSKWFYPRSTWLEALKGDRRGQYSIRINDQWRICFAWTGAGAERVEIVDDY